MVVQLRLQRAVQLPSKCAAGPVLPWGDHVACSLKVKTRATNSYVGEIELESSINIREIFIRRIASSGTFVQHARCLDMGRARPAHKFHQCLIFYPTERERGKPKKSQHTMHKNAIADLFRRGWWFP